MPIVSFISVREVSSEDKVHTAQNLLKQNGKKWKTRNVGEKLAYVVLELTKPQQITAINIGNEHSAFVEVLVSNTSCNSDDFTDILLTCSFMTPIESKNGTTCNRVRCFNKDALVPTAVTQKWKFIKVICTQPFNKHVQYGLSFIEIHTNEKTSENHNTTTSAVSAKEISQQNSVPQSSLQLGSFKMREESPELDSDLLFTRWKHSSIPKNTYAAIQDQSSANNAFTKNIKKVSLEESAHQTKNKEPKSLTLTHDGETTSEIIKRKNRLDDQSEMKMAKLIKTDTEVLASQDIPRVHKTETPINKTLTTKIEDVAANAKPQNNFENKKFEKFNQLLRGVVIVISGIQNPDRADLRTKALAMGAKYKPDWEPCCTHLICAFQNTPKYNQVRGKGKIVKKTWIEDCFEMKKYLPWRRYALDSLERDKPESDEEIFEETLRNVTSLNVDKECNSDKNTVQMSVSDSDTDDEIQRVLQGKKPVKKSVDVFDASTDDEDYLQEKLSSIDP